MANLSTTSLELLVGNMRSDIDQSEEDRKKIIQSFDIIFSQQLLEPNVEASSLIILKDSLPVVINDGIEFYNFLQGKKTSFENEGEYSEVVRLFMDNLNGLQQNQEIYTLLDSSQTFHILVPFVPYGEFAGVFYMRNKPNFDFITLEILSSYDQVALIYTSLILLGLLAMYYISSFTLKERNQAQKLFYEEREQHLKDSIEHNKESLFTKRIYHTHHKAEKVMGFIKEDLRSLDQNNMDSIKNRVNKYANFVSRVIYDMKWYDPPIQTIRNQVFSTDINDVISFVVNNLFLRLSKETDIFSFRLKLDENIPPVHVNEYVVWEIIEPLIQNSIDHASVDSLIISIETKFIREKNFTYLIITDNGKGVKKELLETNKRGIKKIFAENISTKLHEKGNRGYGCYIAFQMATIRCGWKLDAENLSGGGSKFTIEIKN
jgi:signal transduction histidine kinase